MNLKKRSILLGMLLGDGCLKTKIHHNKDGSVSTYYEYVLAHSYKQKEYLERKLDIFHSLIGGKRPKIIYEKRTNSYRFSRRVSSRIVGGRQAVPHSHPWQVLLNAHGKFCGGKLLTVVVILTFFSEFFANV